LSEVLVQSPLICEGRKKNGGKEKKRLTGRRGGRRDGEGENTAD